MRIALTPTLLLSLLCAVNAQAAEVPVIRSHPRLSEQLRLEWNYRMSVSNPFSTVRADSRDAMPVIIRFAHELRKQEERQLLDMVHKVDMLDGRVAHVGPYYGVSVDVAQLQALLEHPLVDRVFTPPLHTVRPLEPTNPFGKVYKWTNAHDIQSLREPNGERYQGQGVTICDLDAAGDVFHPLLFHADGGLYAWVDVNANGRFDVAVDAVDLDGNTTSSPEEVLKKLGGGVVDRSGAISELNVPYHPARHWLYADSNGDGTRNYGVQSGFTEQTPAYGEPLFVADDVNHNGVLDVGEKLLRLKTSKVKGVYRPSTGIAYHRGIDLVSLPVLTDALHGTAVASILVGGEPGLNWVQGLAPQADLLMVVQDSAAGEISPRDPRFDQNIIAAIDWAKGLGTRIFVHEYGSPVSEFADGSGDWEQLLDTLTSAGSVQATAAHNFAGNGGRTRMALQSSQTVSKRLTVYDGTPYGYPVTILVGTVRWRGGLDDLGLTITTLDGTQLDLGEQNVNGRHMVWGSRSVSSRGTGMVYFYYAFLNATGTQPDLLPLGDYVVTYTNKAGTDLDVLSYVTDDSVYAFFVNFEGEHDDSSSMAHPCTADTAIPVAAFQVNSLLTQGSKEGDRAYYSGKGPRIDGVTSVTIAAPADHYAAAPFDEVAGSGHYRVFGGTSGALPQVAGAIALLLGKEPQLDPAQVRERLQSSARADATVGQVSNHSWGWGRLDVPRLLFGKAVDANAAPVVVVNHDQQVTLVDGRASVSLDASSTTDDHDGASALTFRWDADYNGTWEANGTQSTFTAEFTSTGTYWLLLEVEDSVGAASRELLRVDVVLPNPVSSSSSSGESSTSMAVFSSGESSSLPSSSASAVESSSSASSSSEASSATETSSSAVVVSSSSETEVSSSSGTEVSSSSASITSSSVVSSSSATPSSGVSVMSSSSASIASSRITTSSSLVTSSSGVNTTSSSSKASSAAAQDGGDEDTQDGCGSCAQTNVPALWVVAFMLVALRRRR